MINKLSNDDTIVGIKKSTDIIGEFEKNNKPKELDPSTNLNADNEIYKEEIKEYIKDLRRMNLNLRKLYTFVYGNCTENIQTMLKVDTNFEVKSTFLIMHDY